MSRKKRAQQASNIVKRIYKQKEVQTRQLFDKLVNFALPDGALFSKEQFHGNIKWVPEQLAAQGLIWSWQDTKKVTDAFEKTLEICDKLGRKMIAKTYTAFMNALNRYREIMFEGLRVRRQTLAVQISGKYFRTNKWVLMGFDGSRATAPRSTANEKAFCASNYGFSNKAKYGKKKSKGLRRKRNAAQKTEPQEPQVWITMMWHMGLRLPWTWRLGPSNSSERGHVQEMLEQEEFPKDTLFCGDAGFVGYPLWSSILKAGGDFLVRVGGNVSLLSEHADIQKLGGGIVLCWPKDRMKSGDPPLCLRLVHVQVGKTMMWMLTSVLDERKLTMKQVVEYYKLRWLIEVEFRGLKQTIDKHKLRCRNNGRLLAELDWSLQGMAYAELLAMRAQIPKAEKANEKFNPRDRSLAKTLRVLRRTMRNLDRSAKPDSLMQDLSNATVQRYNNRTDKRARYRPKNPDIKPLGDPTIRKLTPEEQKKLRSHELKNAA
jgi:hypothetical protein